MTYKESATAMFSEDHEDRFKSEYVQVLERRDRLFSMLKKWDRFELDFTPMSPRWVLENQRAYMDAYIRTLELRAEIEGFSLKP